jgi:uncharacterized iron-regulated membrane protein
VGALRGAEHRSPAADLGASHTGEAGGLAGQTIAFLASAGGSVLVWTGIALAWRRFRSWRRRAGSGEAVLAPEARQEVSAD